MWDVFNERKSAEERKAKAFEEVKSQRDEARQYARRYYLRYLNEVENFDTAWRRVGEVEAENARLHDALAQAAAGEVDAVKDAQELQRQLAAEKSLRRKAQKYALRQREELQAARAVIADMLDHLTEVLWYPNDDPQVEALRAALGKEREEAQ